MRNSQPNTSLFIKNSRRWTSTLFKQILFVLPMLLVQGFASAQCNPSVATPSNLVSGVDFNYYEGSWNSLPNFEALSPVSMGTTAGFDIGSATSNDYYGFTFEGYVDIPANGTFTFYTSSDDGSKLWIDGDEVVNNDGLHGVREESGQICLDAGLHEIKVDFFEKTGGNVLSASYSGPGISKTSIPVLRQGSIVTPTGNLALLGTASQSSTSAAHGGAPERAIDGNTSGNWSGGSVTHTESESNPWWEVNLGASYSLDNIKIFNRTDGCCMGRLSNFTVSVLNNGSVTFSQSYTSFPNPLTTVDVDGATGNVVRIQLDAGNVLSLAEVEVYGSTSTGTDCAGVVGGSASIDACGICSGGNTGITPSSPQTWYADVDGDGVGEAGSSVQDCNQPTGYVASAGDNCPNDGNKTSPGSCGCGVPEGSCSGCTKTTAFTEAECFDDMAGVVIEPSGSTSEENLGHLHDGDWARYNDLDLSNVNSFNALLSTKYSGRSIQVRLGSSTGHQIGTLSVPNTGQWHDYTSVSTGITAVSGIHDVFLVFKGGSFNIGSFGFEFEEIIEQGDCSDLTSNINVSFTNPTCPNNNGAITVTFADISDRSQIQLSLNGGNSYPVTVNDNTGSYTFTGLSNGQYEIAARYANNVCEFNVAHMLLIQDCGTIDWNPGGEGWMDSFQANGLCWCSSTNFDHELDTKTVAINGTQYFVEDICDELEDHPSYRNRVSSDFIYNDIQCGNGPLNESLDEPDCPGRVDRGTPGCLETGPHWDMEWLASRSRFGASNSNKVGVDTYTNTSAFVLPTIAESTITVDGIKNGEAIKIFALNGDLVLQTIYFDEVYVRDLTPGVYILKTETESVRFTKK